MSQNHAAFLYEKGRPLVVESTSIPSPGPDQILIRNHAVALNPVDSVMAQVGIFISDFPHVLCCDSAGVVVETGSSVTHLKKGDRVFTKCSAPFGEGGYASDGSVRGYGGFREYGLSDADATGRLPDGVSFEDGCVFPLTAMTAGWAMFARTEGRKWLGLERPAVDPSQRKGDGSVVLVWGGSSSVGLCGIQFAVNAGYRVITTASKENFGVCESVGAEKVFDHKDGDVEEQILEWLKGKTLKGTLDAISRYGTIEKSAGIVQKAVGTKRLVIVVPDEGKGIPEGVIWDTIFPPIDDQGEEDLKWMLTEYLPAALENGSWKAGKPTPEVVGHGLEFAQEALDRMSKGVSARKLVVTI